MIGKVAAGALAMAAMGCSTVPPDGMPVHGGDGSCDAARAQPLVGRMATSELGAEAMRLTGADGLRWIPPGAAVTMDYRPGRLNIKLDAHNRVTDFTCG